MNRILFALTLAILLTACAAPVASPLPISGEGQGEGVLPTQTSEVPPAGTMSETSEVWPTPTATEIPLPAELSLLPDGSYTYDAGGLHIALADGQTIDIPSSQIAEMQVNLATP